MKKAVMKVAVAIVLLFLASVARGQGCHPSSSAKLSPFDDNTWAILTPDQLPAGTPYVQFTLTTPDGVLNHAVNVANGTAVVSTWNTYNAPSGAYISSSYTVNGGSSQSLGINTYSGTSTSYTPWAVGTILDYYIELLNSSGGIITVDHTRLTVGAGSAGTINDEDEQDTTLFLASTGSMGGNTGMSTNYCPGAGIARHNTDVRINLTNLNTNELQSTYNRGTSEPAVGNYYINSTTTTIVAILPGDTVKVTRTGRVYCTIAFFFGIVTDIDGVQGTSGDQSVVRTFRTKSARTGKLGPGMGPLPNDTYYTVIPWCINTENPTWDPTKLGIPTTWPANGWNNGNGPGFFTSTIVGVSGPNYPTGWNFAQWSLRVFPTKWFGGGYCDVVPAPY